MGKYAENTKVSVAKSKTDIEKILDRYGAGGFFYGCEPGRAMVGFKISDKQVRFNLILPDRTESRFTHTPTGLDRNRAQSEKAWEQACRSAWRALNMVIHAKLEAVEAGITSLEEEFLAHILLPSGETVGENLIPQIETAYKDGRMPKLLPFSG